MADPRWRDHQIFSWEMSPEEIWMHFAAGEAAGRDSACGTKIQHDTLEGAQSHADALNRRPEVVAGERARVEPYPCVWCSLCPAMGRYYYHVGREMTAEEIEAYGNG